MNGGQQRSNGGAEPSILWLAGPIFLVAAVVRAIPFQIVLGSPSTIFTDSDSYSHMWRIWNAAAKSIPLSARDPFVNFPHGGEVLWSPAFDWILAVVIRRTGLDQPTAEIFCAWVPLVLGAIAVAMAAVITSRTFSRAAGWIAGLMLAILPGNFLYTQLGFLDHHAGVVLITTAMLSGAIRIVEEGPNGPRRWPLAAGALCAFALAIWAGGLIHIGILQGAMLIWALGTANRELAFARTSRLALAHAITAALILPFSLRDWEIFGDFSPLALTRFQPTWFGAGAVALALTAALWLMPSIGASRARRVATAATVGVVGLGVAFVMIPGLAAILDESASWFTSDVEFLDNIVEIMPLFSTGSHPYWWRPLNYLSPLFFVFPLALVAVVWRTTRPARWLLLFWTVALCALTLRQSRFIDTFSIAHSIVWGGALASLLDWIENRLTEPRARNVARAFVAVVVGAAILAPAYRFYLPRLQHAGYASINFDRRALIVIGQWLAYARPVTTDEKGNPESGLLCVWASGHELRYYSGQAVHQDGFGPYVSPENVKLASRYYEATDEDAAIEILEQLRTRYVVADYKGAGHPPYAIPSMARRLVDMAGSGKEVVIDGTGRTQWIPALTRHRLIYAAPNGAGGAWLYEIVRGAVVVGSATPGSLITAELELDSPSGHPRTWTIRQRANETGEFRMRLPYATVGTTTSAFPARGPYRLRSQEGVVEFDVTETAVSNGEILAAAKFE